MRTRPRTADNRRVATLQGELGSPNRSAADVTRTGQREPHRRRTGRRINREAGKSSGCSCVKALAEDGSLAKPEQRPRLVPVIRAFGVVEGQWAFPTGSSKAPR
jgi:hypothetical protein